MDYIGGGDLSKLISQFNLNNDMVKLLIAEMVTAFDYLHSKQIYHRDVKPENILISSSVCLIYYN